MEKLKSGAIKLGINLTPQQLELFEVYYRDLVDWNKRINLTSIIKYEDVQVKHFLDSLTVSKAFDFKNSGKNIKVIDVGTGAGLPGIPLKIAFPHIGLILLESTLKKTGFLSHIIEKIQLKDVEIISSRAETIAHDARFREKFDVVISRAVAALPVLAELMLPLCKVGGICIALKKGTINEEVKQAEKAIAVMGGRLREIKTIKLKELDDIRQLVVIDKIAFAPASYPRRPGMPAKRPIIP